MKICPFELETCVECLEEASWTKVKVPHLKIMMCGVKRSLPSNDLSTIEHHVYFSSKNTWVETSHLRTLKSAVRKVQATCLKM